MGISISRRGLLATSFAGLSLSAVGVRAGVAGKNIVPDAAAIDAVVGRFMREVDIPGIAVAIVTPGVAPWIRGYGVRTLGQAAPVDAHTRFAIASNTKAVTAAALATLVDDKTLDWDDPVVRHIPEFRMYDPAVTQMMTVRDLLLHRSGLPLGAGDLLFMAGSTHVAADALQALPYLKPVRGFRTGYAYDNILYVVAGLLIERVTGQSWREVIASRILRPLGMEDAVPSRTLLTTENVAGRHARLGPPLRGMGPVTVIAADEPVVFEASAGINASATDMAKWLQVQLAQGALPDGKRLWSTDQAAAMWTPGIIVGSSDGQDAESPGRPVTKSYALGWFMQDYRGQRMINHSGALSGQKSQTAILPGSGLGLAVLTNSEDEESLSIRNAILDSLLGAPAFDWVADFKSDQTSDQKDALAKMGGALTQAPAGGPSLPLDAYAGHYRDPWYGDIIVARDGAGLQIGFVPTPAFKGPLEPWGPDTFRTHFPKGAGEDALVMFDVQNGKVAGVTMKPFSPLADFSYDFQHLAFAPLH